MSGNLMQVMPEDFDTFLRNNGYAKRQGSGNCITCHLYGGVLYGGIKAIEKRNNKGEWEFFLKKTLISDSTIDRCNKFFSLSESEKLVT